MSNNPAPSHPPFPSSFAQPLQTTGWLVPPGRLRSKGVLPHPGGDSCAREPSRSVYTATSRVLPRPQTPHWPDPSARTPSPFSSPFASPGEGEALNTRQSHITRFCQAGLQNGLSTAELSAGIWEETELSHRTEQEAASEHVQSDLSAPVSAPAPAPAPPALVFSRTSLLPSLPGRCDLLLQAAWCKHLNGSQQRRGQPPPPERENAWHATQAVWCFDGGGNRGSGLARQKARGGGRCAAVCVLGAEERARGRRQAGKWIRQEGRASGWRRGGEGRRGTEEAAARQPDSWERATG